MTCGLLVGVTAQSGCTPAKQASSAWLSKQRAPQQRQAHLAASFFTTLAKYSPCRSMAWRRVENAIGSERLRIEVEQAVRARHSAAWHSSARQSRQRPCTAHAAGIPAGIPCTAGMTLLMHVHAFPHLVLGVRQLHIGGLARAVRPGKRAGAPGRPCLDMVGVEPAYGKESALRFSEARWEHSTQHLKLWHRGCTTSKARSTA